MRMEFIGLPFPHLRLTDLVDPVLYRDMRFPEISPAPQGRIGRDLYRGEKAWEDAARQPGWNELYRTFSNPVFVKSILSAFRDGLTKYNCGIDVDKIRIEEVNETRPQTEAAILSNSYDPNALFARFDFKAIDASYDKGVHVDWPRRLVGGVLFMCDPHEEGIEGGEFGLFSDMQFRNDRRCHAPKLEAKYPIEPNTGIVCLNWNGGFHGPLPIHKADGLRKWIYYSISSRRNVWQQLATADPVRTQMA